MKKNWLAAFLSCSLFMSASSQTLFTYGKYKTDAAEFLRAFNKNNQQPASARSAAMRDYLGLYINSRLKIREAYDKGFDTLPQVRSEVDNLRNQIIENYLSDPTAVDRLSKEAFQRSLKDIHAAHIFIAYNAEDTGLARRKLNEILTRLGKGEDFLTVAQQSSDDPSAKANKGDLNYITVFTLPYEFENVIYATAPGKISKPYASKSGYHIFKNLGERKGLGKIKIQQILIAFPPGLDEAGKKSRGLLADSLYRRILAGDDFGRLAASFSNDIVGAAAEGNIPDVVVGEFDPTFEKQIWSLPKNGAVSKPFLSEHGYHIVKRIGLSPIVTNPADKTNQEDIRQRVLVDARWKTSKDFIYTAIEKKGGYKKANYSAPILWALSDSLLDYKAVDIGKSMNQQSPLFSIGDTTFTVADWISFAQLNRYSPDRNGIRPYPAIMDDFIKNTMQQYYRQHLEDFNEEFRNQMSEFKDGNLFFEIMQQEVWNKAQADSVALANLYEKNKNNYNWKESAEAVIFFCTDEASAKTLSAQVKKNPADWKKLADAMNQSVVADSGRYEWQQIPGLEKTTPQNGMITQAAVNATDKTASFAYIIKVYTQSSPRSFTEAKGLVMNDYQAILEEEWIKSLKKKYPVTVDENVLAQLIR